ncbi:hypothetical protein E3T27_13300 [Cryobacterium lyxosi]|uniref:Uncharacterized protein n=1 Tax=Cryobacterium lyxosi TaxID=1259228 RepID=A0A4R8ZCG6_9MICO|nr:hypothetical protein E3T27_13300 [Cryobacterium lyxosi]
MPCPPIGTGWFSCRTWRHRRAGSHSYCAPPPRPAPPRPAPPRPAPPRPAPPIHAVVNQNAGGCCSPWR